MTRVAAGVTYRPLIACAAPVIKDKPAVEPQKAVLLSADKVWKGEDLKLEMSAGRSLMSRVKRPSAPKVE